MLDDYDDLTAVEMAAAVRDGTLAASELIDAAIERAEARNPALNAIIHRQFERARADAERVDRAAPLAGVPFLLKDFKGREAGEPYHMGVPTLQRLDYRPRSDSAYALAVRAAGMIPIGRTNTPQLAVMGTTEPELYGPTHNPWALDRSPGGSSGGSAAAVAARIVPVAHANDISGSIRIPAAMCGIVGLKPTRGRVVTSGADSPTGMTVESVVSRTVADTAAAVDALTTRSAWWPAPGWDRALSGELGVEPARLRIGLWTTAFNGSPVDPQSAAAAELAAATLERAGHSIESASPAAYSDPELWETAKTVLAATAAREAAAWEPRIGHPLGTDDLEPRTWAMVQAGAAVSAAEMLDALERQQQLARSVFEWFDRFDLLITPTTATPASPLGEYLTKYVSGLGSAFTRPINVTGHPAISVPLGWPDDGLPRGVQLVAGYGADALLIQVAAVLERAHPWGHRRPPLVVGLPRS